MVELCREQYDLRQRKVMTTSVGDRLERADGTSQAFTSEIEHFLKGEASAFLFMTEVVDDLIDECSSIVEMVRDKKGDNQETSDGE